MPAGEAKPGDEDAERHHQHGDGEDHHPVLDQHLVVIELLGVGGVLPRNREDFIDVMSGAEEHDRGESNAGDEVRGQHQDGGGAALIVPPGEESFPDEGDVEIAEQQRDDGEDDFVIGEQERQARRPGDDPDPAVFIEKAHHANEEEQGERDGEHVVSQVPAVIEDRW